MACQANQRLQNYGECGSFSCFFGSLECRRIIALYIELTWVGKVDDCLVSKVEGLGFYGVYRVAGHTSRHPDVQTPKTLHPINPETTNAGLVVTARYAVP
jgi:hypothetical protein